MHSIPHLPVTQIKHIQEQNRPIQSQVDHGFSIKAYGYVTVKLWYKFQYRFEGIQMYTGGEHPKQDLNMA